jgi:hypothetical protein
VFKKALRGIALLAFAIVLGIASAVVRVRWFGNMGDVDVGPWRTSTATGSSHADAALRAVVAVKATLAMTRDEAIYFVAETDSQGKTLTGACDYHVIGGDPESRWWSLTAYAADRFLVANPDRRYSVSKDSVVRVLPPETEAQANTQATSAGYSVVLSKARPATVPVNNWIALPAGHFVLTLRLYQPAPTITSDPRRATLPVIAAENCT